MRCHPAFSNAVAASLPEMLARRATPLHSYENLRLALRSASRGFLILGPKPSGNGFLDIGERVLLVSSLRDTPGQRGAFRNDPTIFGLR
jgi:hypothetical protein